MSNLGGNSDPSFLLATKMEIVWVQVCMQEKQNQWEPRTAPFLSTAGPPAPVMASATLQNHSKCWVFKWRITSVLQRNVIFQGAHSSFVLSLASLLSPTIICNVRKRFSGTQNGDVGIHSSFDTAFIISSNSLHPTGEQSKYFLPLLPI